MHYLRNFGTEFGEGTEEFDEKARAFSGVLADLVVTLYSHHVTKPTKKGGDCIYHMNSLGQYNLAQYSGYVQGTTAIRNICELARRLAHEAVQVANARAPHLEALHEKRVRQAKSQEKQKDVADTKELERLQNELGKSKERGKKLEEELGEFKAADEGH